MDCTVRSVRPGEAPRLAAFAAELFRQAYGRTHPEPTLSRYLAASFASGVIADRLADPETTYLVAETGEGEWVAYAELHAGGPVAPRSELDRPLPGRTPLEIVRFYVDRAWHGRGVAHQLMARCDAAARERGADVLWLQAWQEAAQALRFYEKAGFVVQGRAIFRFGERADQDFLLARPVAAAAGASLQTEQPGR